MIEREHDRVAAAVSRIAWFFIGMAVGYFAHGIWIGVMR